MTNINDGNSPRLYARIGGLLYLFIIVLGAGPAGLSCAHELALAGFSVTVFEAQNVAGGMLVLGVPEYRLPREVIQAEIKAIE